MESRHNLTLTDEAGAVTTMNEYVSKEQCDIETTLKNDEVKQKKNIISYSFSMLL